MISINNSFYLCCLLYILSKMAFNSSVGALFTVDTRYSEKILFNVKIQILYNGIQGKYGSSVSINELTCRHLAGGYLDWLSCKGADASSDHKFQLFIQNKSMGSNTRLSRALPDFILFFLCAPVPRHRIIVSRTIPID